MNPFTADYDTGLVSTALADADAHMNARQVFAQRLAGHDAVEATADGPFVTLSDGRSLIDFGSYGVALLGHQYPAVVEAVKRQLDAQAASTRVFVNPVAATLAKALSQRIGRPLDRVLFGCTGADAVEAALKLARAETGRPRVLALKGGFHGKTLGALAATAYEPYRRSQLACLAPSTHAATVQQALEALEVGDVAAFIFEPVQGEAGAFPVRFDVLDEIVAACKAAGVFVISDEVQCGLGRCGYWSVARHRGLDVDAVLLGKALGGGVMPLSAVVGTDRLFAPVLRDPFLHTSTFSGHPLACAAGIATVEVLDEFIERVPPLADRIEQLLYDVVGSYPSIFNGFCGEGLLWGLTTTSSAAAGEMLLGCFDSGLVVSPCLSAPSTIRILPPIIASDGLLDEGIRRLRTAAAAASTFTRSVHQIAVDQESSRVRQCPLRRTDRNSRRPNDHYSSSPSC